MSNSVSKNALDRCLEVVRAALGHPAISPHDRDIDCGALEGRGCAISASVVSAGA